MSATRAIARGLTAGWPGARIDACPISDGGTAFSLVSGPMTTEAAMASAEALLERTGRALGTLLRAAART